MTEFPEIKRINQTERLSKALVANGFVFLSGLTARDTSGGVDAQTHDILDQIDGLLKLAGSSKEQLVSVNIWLKDISDFAEMNKSWIEWIDGGPVPARATVEARLAREDIRVEIMAKALAPKQ